MPPETIDRIIPPGIPATVVTSKILVNETEIPLSVGVISCQIYHEFNRISSLRLIIEDGNVAEEDFSISSQDLFTPGNKIEVLAGYDTNNQSIFKGIIVCHALRVRSGYSQLIVDCRDSAYRMTLMEKTRIFEEKTDSDIIEEILADYEISADSSEATNVQHAHMVQFRLSDWDFIILRAEANGFVCLPDAGTLHLVKPNISAPALAAPVFGASILELDAEIDGRNQVQSLSGFSWDSAAQEYTETAATDPTWADNGNISATDLATSTGAESNSLYHGGSVANDEMQAWADSRLFWIRSAKCRGRLRLRGWNEVKPGITLDLQGLGTKINGKVYVTGVRHEINLGTWVTDAQFGFSPEQQIKKLGLHHSLGKPLLPPVAGLQIGVVTQLAGDPNDEYRILVKVPAFSPDSDGVWARIATLDAGNERGTYFLPEVGDEVVLGFLDDDPRHPVLLGMLHSSAKLSPQEISDENHIKGYTSRSKIKLTFDDDKKIVTLETPGGNKLILDDDQGSIVINDSNGNKIVLDSNGINLESDKKITINSKEDIKAETKANLEIKATQQLKLSSTSGTELSSSAITTIKGSLVKIN